MTSATNVQRTPIEDRLRTESTVWLSSTRPDGRPHIVPVWFNWDGQVFDLFSKPSAQKVRNIREHADVMLAIGQPDEDFDVELVEGKASVLDVPTADVIRPQMFEKYADLMARAGLDRQTYVEVYNQPMRISPTRFLGYGGKGWIDPRFSPDGKFIAAAGTDRELHLVDLGTVTERAVTCAPRASGSPAAAAWRSMPSPSSA